MPAVETPETVLFGSSGFEIVSHKTTDRGLGRCVVTDMVLSSTVC
jgi:hypothetical protein